MMRWALQDYNIHLLPFPLLKVVPSAQPTIWRHIDRTVLHEHPTTKDLSELMPPLPFEVRYQLEVCISHGILNEHNLTEEFITKLYAMEGEAARNLLEYIANQKTRIFEPSSIFDLQISLSASRDSMPDYCALNRSVTVTPTTLYFNTPLIETSNRIIRWYPKYTDRFIRVRFTDEKLEVSISIPPSPTVF